MQTSGPEPTHQAGDQTERMNEALRAWYAAFSDLGRQFSLHLGMHGSDAAALVEITTAEDQDAPLTQTQLARRIGLTAPATSTLLSRLEDAGHIERHRSRTDRRVVTLRSTPTMHDEVHRFFRSIGDDVDALTGAYPADTLSGFTGLITDMTAVMNQHLSRLTSDRP